jgi:hypothetical protein
MERQVRERTEAGLHTDGLPDFSTEGERDGFYQAQLIRELAVRHITSWAGVELEGGPAPLTRENIAAVMELVWGSFCQAPMSGAASPFRSFSARAAQSR